MGKQSLQRRGQKAVTGGMEMRPALVSSPRTMHFSAYQKPMRGIAPPLPPGPRIATSARPARVARSQ